MEHETKTSKILPSNAFRELGPGGLVAESNPIVVSAAIPRVLWADLHGHSNFSDGTGTPEDYFLYARDVAALDVAALTDHDHWGMLPLESHPEMWQEIRRETQRFHQPGRFVTLLGYEWTSWIHGHRHVLYFGDEGEIFDSVDPSYESPLQLWQALAWELATVPSILPLMPASPSIKWFAVEPVPTPIMLPAST